MSEIFVLQKLAEDKVCLQRRRDVLKSTVQQLGRQYEDLKTQLTENETHVQVHNVAFVWFLSMFSSVRQT